MQQQQQTNILLTVAENDSACSFGSLFWNYSVHLMFKPLSEPLLRTVPEMFLFFVTCSLKSRKYYANLAKVAISGCRWLDILWV